MSDKEITLVIGGCRSGKSRYALDSADQIRGSNKKFLATSVPRDREMDLRVARHKAERGFDWQTIEEPVEIHRVIETCSHESDVILVDCLTLWVSNLMEQGKQEPEVMDHARRLVHALARARCPVFLVTNEVGYGIVPDNVLARQFRDLAGFVNQAVAGAAHRVVMTVAGIDVQIKPPLKG